jgi:hypothetical protein
MIKCLQKTVLITILLVSTLYPLSSFAAIQLTSTRGYFFTTGSSLSWSASTTDNGLLAVGIYFNDNTDTCTDVKFNGNAMTFVADENQSGGGGRTEWTALYYLETESSVSGNVVVTCTGSLSNGLYTYSNAFSGVDVNDPVSATTSDQNNSANSLSGTLSSSNNEWFVVMSRNSGGNIQDGTNFVKKRGSSIGFGDSNQIATSDTVTVNAAVTYNMMFEAFSINELSTETITNPKLIMYNNDMPKIETVVCETATCTINYATSTEVYLTPINLFIILVSMILMGGLLGFLAYKFL